MRIRNKIIAALLSGASLSFTPTVAEADTFFSFQIGFDSFDRYFSPYRYVYAPVYSYGWPGPYYYNPFYNPIAYYYPYFPYRYPYYAYHPHRHYYNHGYYNNYYSYYPSTSIYGYYPYPRYYAYAPHGYNGYHGHGYHQNGHGNNHGYHGYNKQAQYNRNNQQYAGNNRKQLALTPSDDQPGQLQRPLRQNSAQQNIQSVFNPKPVPQNNFLASRQPRRQVTQNNTVRPNWNNTRNEQRSIDQSRDENIRSDNLAINQRTRRPAENVTPDTINQPDLRQQSVRQQNVEQNNGRFNNMRSRRDKQKISFQQYDGSTRQWNSVNLNQRVERPDIRQNMSDKQQKIDRSERRSARNEEQMNTQQPQRNNKNEGQRNRSLQRNMRIADR